MKLRVIFISICLILILIGIGFYQYDLYQDRNHRFQYSEELHLHPKYSFANEDKYEVIPPGKEVKILRIRYGKDSQDVYVEVNRKTGWVSSLNSKFEILKN